MVGRDFDVVVEKEQNRRGRSSDKTVPGRTDRLARQGQQLYALPSQVPADEPCHGIVPAAAAQPDQNLGVLQTARTPETPKKARTCREGPLVTTTTLMAGVKRPTFCSAATNLSSLPIAAPTATLHLAEDCFTVCTVCIAADRGWFWFPGLEKSRAVE